MKLSIIIPTKNRASTIGHTLKTILSQSYQNYEVIISDNQSEDNTAKIISGFIDKRIKYFRTTSRLGMTQNWENALSKVTGDYVSCIGDDDGFLPNAFQDVVSLFEATKSNAIVWRKADYLWPGVHGADGGRLTISFSNRLIEYDGLLLLRLIANANTSYGRLPVIYSGFISMNNVLDIKNKTGTFFGAATPDIYSGIVLASSLKKYIYSSRPFSINGSCATSNGIARGSDIEQQISKDFFNELQSQVHPKMPLLDGDAQIQSCIAEAYLQAYDRGLTNGIKINYKKHLYKIFELIINQRVIRKDQLDKFLRLELPKRLSKSALRAKYYVGEKKYTEDLYGAKGKSSVIKCKKFNINNVEEASIFLFDILGDYKKPKIVIKYNLLTILVSLALRKINKKLENFSIEF